MTVTWCSSSDVIVGTVSLGTILGPVSFANLCTHISCAWFIETPAGTRLLKILLSWDLVKFTVYSYISSPAECSLAATLKSFPDVSKWCGTDLTGLKVRAQFCCICVVVMGRIAFGDWWCSTFSVVKHCCCLWMLWFVAPKFTTLLEILSLAHVIKFWKLHVVYVYVTLCCCYFSFYTLLMCCNVSFQVKKTFLEVKHMA